MDLAVFASHIIVAQRLSTDLLHTTRGVRLLRGSTARRPSKILFNIQCDMDSTAYELRDLAEKRKKTGEDT